MGIHYLDCGVSGGVWGKQLGYALMVGGEKVDVDTCMPIFQALKPEGEYGFVHAGSHGAGHYAKMVHNGIEYAIMQAYAEGWELLEAAGEIDDVPGTFTSWKERSFARGCWTCWCVHSKRIPIWTRSRGTPMIPAKGVGLCSQPLTWWFLSRLPLVAGPSCGLPERRGPRGTRGAC